MKKKDKILKLNYFLISILTIGICLCVAPYTAAFLITDKDNIKNEVKTYYIDAAILYFEDFSISESVTIDELSKRGYAKVIDDIKPCKKDGTYIKRENDIYTFKLNCERFRSEFTIRKGE